jgi:hypothetical protein
MFTGRMKNLIAKVVNLKEGVVEIQHDNATLTVESGGEFPVPDSSWIQFQHNGSSKHLICTIQSRNDAVHSD